MKNQNRAHPTYRVLRRAAILLAVLATLVAACSTWNDEQLGSSEAAVATAPSLGTAASFAVLGGQTVTNTGLTVLIGDLGVSPGTAITGFPPGIVTGGVIHAGDPVAAQAQADVTIAYNQLAGQALDFDLTGQDLGGLTLVPGVYFFSSSAQLTGNLTLDAEGDPNAVFVFQIGSTLTTASNSSVTLINGAQRCNVFWQVGSSATLGTGTQFIGNILALTSITLTTGANVLGRALARNGSVTMDTNKVTNTACGAVTPEPPGCQTFDWIIANQGFIFGTPSGEQGDFAFALGIRNGVLKGNFHYNDTAANQHIVSTSVTSYIIVNATTRLIMGTATVNGVPGFTYTILATDGGANDSFTLTVSNGYTASGTLNAILLTTNTCP